MKVVQVNTVCGNGSTGKIVVEVSQMLTEMGVENYVFYNSGTSTYPLGIKYMSDLDGKLQAVKTRVLGNFGFNSQKATRKLIAELERIRPDIVHLHNLHGNTVHLGMLVNYLKKRPYKIFWTFHDCWTFTGYCSHYDRIGCNQWREEGGCHRCPKRRATSWFFDRSHYLYEKKKALFSDLDMTVITPSRWLADQVKQSFLKNCDVRVIHNGINLKVFHPCESEFRKKYHLEDKYIVLGVSQIWCIQKGTDVFVELSKRLDDRFRIVMVGTNDQIDKQLPESIISIHRTNNQAELAKIYAAADVFVNPTREEVLGLTNIEALACGTPVITFATGGSPETLSPDCGCSVPKNDLDGLESQIRRICETKPYMSEACVERAQDFDTVARFRDYIALYTEKNL